MPNYRFLSAVLLLCVAVACNVAALWQRIATLDASALGHDAASATERRFAAVCANVPPGSIIRIVEDGDAWFTPSVAASDQIATLLRALLSTGTMPDVPPAGAQYLAELREYYLVNHPDGATHDFATVRANLVDAYRQLTRGNRDGSRQYALAPRLITTAPTAERILGDFPAGFDARGFAARNGLELRTDYGDGLVLFEPRR